MQSHCTCAYNAGSRWTGHAACFDVDAGVAQLVERNLAKVEVESSRLFSRSKFETGSLGFPFLSAMTVLRTRSTKRLTA